MKVVKKSNQRSQRQKAHDITNKEEIREKRFQNNGEIDVFQITEILAGMSEWSLLEAVLVCKGVLKQALSLQAIGAAALHIEFRGKAEWPHYFTF